jgi:hypothetical protein
VAGSGRKVQGICDVAQRGATKKGDSGRGNWEASNYNGGAREKRRGRRKGVIVPFSFPRP